jgi:SAM-dependent methyltransferase
MTEKVNKNRMQELNIKNSEEIIHWHIGNKVRHDVVEKMDYRAHLEKKEFLCKSLKGINIRDIHREAISRGERYRRILDIIIQMLNIPNNSVCADLGAGTATFAALISLQPKVQKVYTVEISEQFTKHIMPITFDYFKVPKEKIVRIVGDFNNLEFEDNSLDFTVETGSFHHSENIATTLSECYRVLRPGGFLLAVERARFNTISKSKKKIILNKELSKEMKKKYGILDGESYTREMWGEHEYTFDEWNRHLKAASFLTKMVVVNTFALFLPILRWVCSVGRSGFEPFYIKTQPYFIKNPLIYYELLSVPIFICIKPYINM